MRALAPSRNLVALVASAVFVVVAMFSAAPAYAHAQLVSSNPADGASLTAPVSELQMTFSEHVQAKFSVVRVAAPDGKEIQTGPATTADTVLSQPITSFVTDGRYAVEYRVISADGHPITGSLGFDYTGPLSSAAAPVQVSTAAAADDRSFLERHVLQLAIPFLAALLVGFADLLRKRRKRIIQ